MQSICSAYRSRPSSREQTDSTATNTEVRGGAGRDTAQYGMIHLGQRDLATALRQAWSLVGFAAETVNR